VNETCRVSFQNKFEKLVLLVGFIRKKLREALAVYAKRVSAKLCEQLLFVLNVFESV
jgi:hypothetical protein